MTTTTRRLGSTALAALMIGGLTATAPASAKDGDGRVIVRGDCSRRADWKLKAKPDDGRMEVELEVDSTGSDSAGPGPSATTDGVRLRQAHDPGPQRLLQRRAADVGHRRQPADLGHRPQRAHR